MTLNVLKHIALDNTVSENPFKNKKILVIHSGGDSKRVPQYSVCGVYDENNFHTFVNDYARISFYGDFLYPLVTDATLEDYYTQASEGDMCDEEKMLLHTDNTLDIGFRI